MTVDEIISEAKRAIRGEPNRLNIGVTDASYLLALAFSLGIVNANGVVPAIVQHLDRFAREAGLAGESSQQADDVAGGPLG